jgi:hypothetical protein
MVETISEIIGGTKASTRKPGETISNADMLECYYRTPGASGIVEKIIGAKWGNGFNEDLNLPEDKLLELQAWDQWSYVFGFSVLVVNGANLQAWNPKTNGTGFEFISWGEDGQSTQIQLWVDGAKAGEPIPRGSGGSGYYALRTRAGLPGERGVSLLLGLLDVLQIQTDLFVEFLAYAKIHGYTHKVIKIGQIGETQELTAEVHDAYYNRFNTTSKESLVIIGAKDEFDYKSPTMGQYDPVKLMEFGDNLIARQSSMTRMHLTGNPQGHLSSSQDASANFYAWVKAEQAYTKPKIMEVLKMFGATDNIKFNKPEEVTMESQANTIKAMREALEGLVENEDIVELINEYLGYVEGSEDALRVKEDVSTDRDATGASSKQPPSTAA